MGNSLTCGAALTNPCVGDTDPRYNPEVSNNILDQSEVWSAYAGYWGSSLATSELEDGTPRPPAFYNITSGSGVPYKLSESRFFEIRSFVETRMKYQVINIYPPAPAEFCNQSVPPGMANAIGDDICGVNGYAYMWETFGTSTHEKDGQINRFWTTVNIGPGGGTSSGSYIRPVGKDAVLWYNFRPGVFTKTYTDSYISETKDRMMGTGSVASHAANGSVDYSSFFYTQYKMNETLFFTTLLQAYVDANVKDIPDWATAGGPVPSCLAESWNASCPNNSDWCGMGNDPSCSESPFQEPPVSIKTGAIAGFVIAGFVVLCAVLFAVHRILIKKQERRIKRMFVSRITEGRNLRESISQLQPLDLAKEFKRISGGLEGNDGFITREELWNFVSSEKAGKMKKADFDALFSAMDLKNRGKVSFMDFCAFMSTCGSEFRNAVDAERIRRQNRASQSVSSTRPDVLLDDESSCLSGGIRKG